MRVWIPAGVRAGRLLVLIITTAALAGVAITAPAQAADRTVHYVALGDSRAAGPSITSAFEPSGCDRSGGGYPERVAGALRPASFTDVACDGATTDNVIRTPQTTPLPIRRVIPVQAQALRRDTTLVTISIGGNDVQWGSLISPCFGTSPDIDVHWFNGQLPRGDGLPNHPTQVGNAAIARLVLASIGR